MLINARVVKILLIEEDKIDQAYVKQVLDQQHILYQMRIVASSEDALHFLENENHSEFDGHPDVILLDIDRKKTNSLEFISLFRKKAQWAGIRVFVLSDSDEQRQRMMETGVAGYIVKPLKLRSPSRDTISFLIDLMNISAKR